ncbi:aldehyde dehydrogenase [Salipiger sp.]|uniref:aldehyde dehydrogenase n=1 Tax=Salipiger sp. TaxID=2078585 RepID=UPI003A9831D1
MTETYKLYIDGKWVAAADQEYFPAINPYSGETWAMVPQASDSQVAEAIDSARAAFETSWRKTSGWHRAQLLMRLADLLEADADRMSVLETTDNGKVIRETRSQMHFAARAYRFFAGYADKIWGKSIPLDDRDILDYTRREPAGVVVAVTAWNSPMHLLSNKLAPAIAAGNCIVIKPSEHASCTTLEFAKLVEAAGFPPGVVNVVTGDARVGKALLSSGRVDCVSFTGSPAVGREISAAAGRRLIPVTMELGGKSPNIIFEDADIRKATIGALAGIFGGTGQSCIAGSRLFVQRPVYQQVAETLVARARSIKLGNPLDPATEMGTAANKAQFDRILSCISGAVDAGANLLTGGKAATGEGLDNGFFIEPTIFGDVRNDMQVAQEEIFGPVLSILPFDTEEEVVALGNDTDFGLAAGIWTTNLSRAMRVSREIRAGMVWVNTYRAAAVQAPFGGIKDSGSGRERGEEALDPYTVTKNVMVSFSDEERDPFAMKL